ncbi:MAG: thiamine pyrophosphate-dependent enzyme [Phenylobacterium sp.]|uniref:thiamine pyrophosphate-dependent enzyme n=1 Tax=Phenylobacterium sp. TaxID=1871053 RepID=UPI00391DBF72
MSSPTAGDVLVETLIDWGVDTIFGIPGDGVNGIIESLRRKADAIRFIQTRHEEAAAFMACAYAKWTGRLGVCLATSGPGGIHLLNGLYDAKLDGQPVLAITGLQFHDLLHTDTQQDVELDKLFMDVAAYNCRVMGAAHMENVAALAIRTALARRAVAHITVPVDVQDQPVKRDARSKRNIAHHVSGAPAQPRLAPPETDLERAADILNACEKPFILAGRGALGCSDLLGAVAERLGAPVGKALLGKGALDDEHPHCVGGVGLLGTRPSHEAMSDCDGLLIVGSAFPYIEFYPKPGQARAVQIDIAAERIGLRYPVECGLVGDCRTTLERLAPLLRERQDRSFLQKAQEGMKDWRELMAERGQRRDLPMKPQVVAYELDKLLADDALVSTDSGTITTWIARQMTFRQGQMFACSGNLATMACGLPYAAAAAVAYPGRQVVSFVGDGGMTMLIGELATCVKYGLDVKIVVIKNNSLGQIKWEQMVFLGHPEYVCDLQPVDFAAIARGFGVTAFTIEDPARCGEVMRQAFATPGPVLIEAVVDPNEPPMPPTVTFEQAKHFAEALAKGTPGRGEIIKTVTGDRLRELI